MSESSQRLRSGRIARLAWLPIPLLAAAIIIGRAAGVQESYKSESLTLVLSFTFYTLVSLGTLVLIGRAFLASGLPGLLLLECGVVLWSLAGTVADAVSHGDANVNVTIFNTGILLAGLCHLAGAILSSRPRRALRAAPLWLGAGCALALGALWSLTRAALTHRLPVFFVPGQGGTPVRYCVLISAIAMFVLSAGFLLAARRVARAPFASWYTLALLLLAVGLFGVMIQLSLGSVVNWLGRTAQWLGGLYLLIAAIAALRELHLPLLPSEEKSLPQRYRFGVAIAIVLAAAAVRLVFLSALGTRAPYLVFFPAVMFAAIYGGSRAGLLATILAATIVNYFWIEPVGRLAIGQPGDWLGLAIFILSGSMIVWISQAMRMSEEEFRSLAEAVPQIVWATRPDGSNVYFNQQWVDYTGMTMEESRGDGWNTPFHPNDKQLAWEAWQYATQHNGHYSLECRLRRKDGVYRWWLIRGTPMLGANGKIQKWFGTCTDIEDLKRSEAALQEAKDLLEQRVAERTAALRESEQRERQRAEELAALFEAVPLPVFIARDSDCLHLTGNRLADEILRIPHGNELSMSGPAETKPRHFRALKDGRELRLDELPAQRAARGTYVADFEFTIAFDDGIVREVLGYGAPLLDDHGRPRGTVAVLVDITERKRAENRLQASLREKEVLLKEIHHRVKNNLQVISSLVDLQADALQEPALRGVFAEMRDRVRSMALVHEKLYQSESLARVELADYTRSLLNYLAQAHSNLQIAVGLRMELKPTLVPVEVAAPCGLIVNELVTNAFRHAFRGRDRGEITVALSTGPDGRLCLRVSDDGVGFPAGMDWRQSRSLGLQLVHLLARQLNATVEVRTDGGTEFLISFELSQAELS